MVIGARNPELGRTAASKLLDQQIDARFVALGVNQERTVETAAATLATEFECLDILVKEEKMSTVSNTEAKVSPAIPADDPRRNLVLKNPDSSDAMHLAVTGDTYTILLSGTETAGRFTLIDMHVPPGGGPPPHRHDFEETFILLDGELQATFRGEKRIVRAGETIHIPANAPHQFHNASSKAVRMLCICSPAGQEEFFKEIGAPVATRTTPPPKIDVAQETEFFKKVIELAPKYRNELLREA